VFNGFCLFYELLIGRFKLSTIAFNGFVRRQRRGSAFSYTTLPDEVLIRRVQENFDRAKPGYRDGVLLVPVPPDHFVSGVVQLEEGQALAGVFKPRREGELSQKIIFSRNVKRLPARSVNIVLYSHESLGGDADTDSDYEIVSINASPLEGEEPITPEALMANYFGDPGASKTGMSPEAFVSALQVSRDYWRDKTMVCPLEGDSDAS
jgi:hypothetical protein